MKNKFDKNKLKDGLKKFFKEHYQTLILLIVFLILMIPMPYYITIGGGVINMDDKIMVDGEIDKKGSISSCYVSELKGNIGTFLLSYVIPSFERTKISDVVLDEEDVDDYEFREKMSFVSSYELAKKVAFEAHGLKVEEKLKGIYVVGIDKDAITTLKGQDKILKIGDKKITKLDDLKDILKDKKVNETIAIEVLRNGKKVMAEATLQEKDGTILMGIYLMSEYQYVTDKVVKFDSSSKESGPSGGLMMSLSIYNKLGSNDITKGKMVVGTGTIDSVGNVGEIGGVKYKVQGAIKNKADVFLVPKGNYEEAKKELDKHDTKMKLIMVETFDDALKKLKEMD